MAAKLKDKRASFTTVRDQFQSFATLPDPPSPLFLIDHYLERKLWNSFHSVPCYPSILQLDELACRARTTYGQCNLIKTLWTDLSLTLGGHPSIWFHWKQLFRRKLPLVDWPPSEIQIMRTKSTVVLGKTHFFDTLKNRRFSRGQHLYPTPGQARRWAKWRLWELLKSGYKRISELYR